MPMTVHGLIRKHRPVWNLTVRNPFVSGVHDGTLQHELFDAWLVQARHLLDGHFAPVCRLLASAPRRDRPLLLEGLEIIQAELDWYRGLLAERGLDPSAPLHPIMLTMKNQVGALGFEPYVVGLVAFWTQGRTYVDAWTRKREPRGAYRAFLRRWGDPRAGVWVQRLGRAADRALADATPHERMAAEEAFLRVVHDKLSYWVMTLG
jgi:thiaminase